MSSESHINSHSMLLLRRLGFSVHTRSTIRAEVVREILRSKTIFLEEYKVQHLEILIKKKRRSGYPNCLVVVVKSHVNSLGEDHEVAVDMADGT